ALAQDRPLSAPLPDQRLLLRTHPLAPEEPSRILEVIASDHLAQRLAGLQGLAVTGVNVTNLSLRHSHERNSVDSVLPAPVSKVKSTAEHFGLEARLATQCNDLPFGNRSLLRPELLDDPNPVVGDVSQAGQLTSDHDQGDRAQDPEQARPHSCA